MDPAQFFSTSRLVIVAGKGGVGKTTVAAALARAAAISGLSCLLIEVEGKGGLAAKFGSEPLEYDDAVLMPGGGPEGAADVLGRTLTPDVALMEYLQDHGMSRISKRLVTSGAMDMVTTAAPGIKDILILGKVKQLERSGDYDFIVLDAPAAGHAITFLQAARGLMDAVRVGPIFTQAKDVLEMLTDDERCSVMLVTLPEETPVNELTETAFKLEDRVGISLGPVVVNGLYPEIDGIESSAKDAAKAADATLRKGEAATLDQASEFRRERMALQAEQVARLEEQLPLPQIRLPYMFTSHLGPPEIESLARALLVEIDQLEAP